MPTGTKGSPRKLQYRGTMAEQFDVIDEIGGRLIEIGQRIRKAAIHFPVTADWILDDLLEAGEFAASTAERFKKAMETL